MPAGNSTRTASAGVVISLTPGSSVTVNGVASQRRAAVASVARAKNAGSRANATRMMFSAQTPIFRKPPDTGSTGPGSGGASAITSRGRGAGPGATAGGRPRVQAAGRAKEASATASASASRGACVSAVAAREVRGAMDRLVIGDAATLAAALAIDNVIAAAP